MTGRGLLAGGTTHGLARALRGLAPAGRASTWGPRGAVAGASVHGQAAIQLSGFVQGNAARCSGLKQRLPALRVPGGPAGAALERETAPPRPVIAWQTKMAARQLSQAPVPGADRDGKQAGVPCRRADAGSDNQH